MHDLPGKELRDREPDGIGRRTDVGDDAARLRAGLAARLGAPGDVASQIFDQDTIV